MKNNKCKFCNLPIILVPSAIERAANYGGKPSDYRELFTTHNKCEIYVRDKADKITTDKYYRSLMGGKPLTNEEFKNNADKVK